MANRSSEKSSRRVRNRSGCGTSSRSRMMAAGGSGVVVGMGLWVVEAAVTAAVGVDSSVARHYKT